MIQFNKTSFLFELISFLFIRIIIFKETFMTLDYESVKMLLIHSDRYAIEAFLGNGFYYSQYLLGTYSHNNYIEILLNNGFVGFCVYYFCYVKMFGEARSLKKTFPLSYVLIMTTMMTFLAMDVGTVSYFNRYTLIILMFCCNSCAIYKMAAEESYDVEENNC